MVRERTVAELAAWIQACQVSGINEVASFAQGLQREEPVIPAALELPYSNGITEGRVNRLKMIKRTPYEQASFEVFRRRVLVGV